ncbi:hypothetical protein [Pseudomonas sp. FW300-N2F2]|uniref:hypothetical protein n=1 Tax=Pseudomonas sp. FW300-N2F2 TaxID=2751320 RepID=UPI001A933B88|nr:hypothetical protein [Pseudomonas sp. FW300-N2F2]
MPDINDIVAEAEKIRRALELCDKETTPLITKDFPAMNCKLSSLILTYHILKKWPTITVYGVSGVATDHYGNDTISHYWLEHQATAIDITADQYNIIEDKDLNTRIISNRPFNPVSSGRIGSLPNYSLFKITNRDIYISGLPELAEDFLEKLHNTYEILTDISPSV